MSQIMKRGPAVDDYRRRREAESHGTAIKRIKRRIARSVYTRLRADLTPRPVTTATG
jgi:hypothetical protein